MQRMFYYAKLNENNVCYGFESLTKKIEDTSTLVYLNDYNETYLYKKWLGDQWSQETYEPSIDTVIQDKLIILEEANEQLQQETLEIKGQNSMMEGMLMEMMIMLAALSSDGGAE